MRKGKATLMSGRYGVLVGDYRISEFERRST